MISLTRLNGCTVAINPDLIASIDVTPDTTVALLGGERIIVRENLDEVVEKIIAFRRLVGDSPRLPSSETIYASLRRAGKTSERPTGRTSSTSVRTSNPPLIVRK
jgi:flagellar protein FlbD